MVWVKPTEPTRRTQAYRILRDDCGLTHHQARHLIHIHLRHLGAWSNIMWRENKREKRKWIDHSNGIALLSMREDPRDAGRAILNACWKEQIGEPELPFICASMAAEVVKNTRQFTDKERRVMWSVIEKLLRHEEREAEILWDERMLLSYLRIRKVL